MRGFLIAVVVLLAVLVAGDRVAASLASGEAERRLAKEGFVDPQVDVHGFPFVTQLLSRDFSRVSLTSKSVTSGAGRARRIHADLHDVRAPQGGPVSVVSMTAAGTVPYDVVSGAVGVPSLRLSSASGGQVRLARTVRLLGEDFDVTARAKVQTSGTRIRLIPTSVQLADGGPLSGQLSSLIRDRVALDYRIPGLPKGLELRSVSAQPGGFVVDVTGRDLAVSSLQ